MTLHLGDCLEVMAGMEADSVDAIVTDPPYGVDYQSAWRTDRRTWKPKIANDKAPFIWWLYQAARVLREPGAVLCFCRWDTQDVFQTALEAAGLTVKSQVIWDRVGHGMGDLTGAFAPQHDVIWFATKGRFTFPGSRPKSVISVPRLAGSVLQHPNEKPVELMCQLVTAICPPGGTVLDPFMGSGTTGVAAVQEGRFFIGIELDPEYHRIAQARIAHAEQGQLAMFG